MIRHGRPEWRPPFLLSLSQFEHTSAGYDATCLSREGTTQIEILAKQLPKALILSSDLCRARETAEIIGRECGVMIEFDSLFRELQAPRITTCLLDRLWAHRVIWSLVHWCCWITGVGQCSEGPRAAWNRTAQATDKILAFSGTEKNIILVTHGWFMIMLALHLRSRRLIERGPFIPRVRYGAATEYLLRANGICKR